MPVISAFKQFRGAQEVAMSNCAYGCKVMRCRCGYQFVLHYSVYGCTTPGIQHSSTGARCTCKAV